MKNLKLLPQILLAITFILYSSARACDKMNTSIVSNQYIGNNQYLVTIQYCETPSNSSTSGSTAEVYGVIMQVVGANIVGTTTNSVTSSSTGVTINYSTINSNTVQWGEWDNNPAAPLFIEYGDPSNCYTFTLITDGPISSVSIGGSSAASDLGLGFTTWFGRHTCKETLTVPSAVCNSNFTPPTICVGSTTPIDLKPTVAVPASSGVFSGSGVTAAGIFTPSGAAGSFSITYTIPGGPNCSTTKNITTVSLTPTTLSNQSVCSGSSANLNATLTGTGSPFTYSWSPATGLSNANIANPVATPSSTTTYTVTISSASLGCSTQTPVTISVVTCPPIQVCNNGTQLVATGGGGPYIWNYEKAVVTNTPINNKTECLACGGTANYIFGFYSSCSKTTCPTTSYVWTQYATGSPAANPPNFGLQVTDGMGTVVTYTTLASIPSCNACTPPALVLNNQTVCSPSTVDLNTTIGASSGVGNASFYSSSANANSATSPIGAVVSTSGVYYVRYQKPTDPACFTVGSVTITVNPLVTPTFAPVAPICVGAPLAALPTTSTNSITGTWSPATNNAATTTYTFTPTAGQCASTATMTITVNPTVTPTFTAVAPICAGTPLAALPTTSTNSITGTWSPAINNTTTTTYTFTPTVGLCATTTTMTITVNPSVTPTFNPVAPICAGDALAALPTTSTNGLTGTWSPVINNTATTTYTFTPSSGTCNLTSTMTITVNPLTIPTFTPLSPVCVGNAAPVLPLISNNGITGTWSPVISTATAGTFTYTFTPNPGQCAATATNSLTVTANAAVPTFTSVGPLCQNSMVVPLATTSNEGITGIWSPSISTTTPGTTTYTFTSDPGQCALNTTMDITINPLITSSFNALTPVCIGATVPVLPLVSNNGVSGTWSPVISTATAGTFTYTFTPDAGQCATSTTLDLIVNPSVTPTFNPLTAICIGDNAPVLSTTSSNGITGSWSGAPSNAVVGTFTYTFTPNPRACYLDATINFVVHPKPSVDLGPDIATCINQSVNLNAVGNATTYSWSNGLPNGNSHIVNPTVSTVYTVTATDVNGCISTDAINVTVNTVNVYGGADKVICVNDDVTLTASGAQTYSWNKGVINGVAFQPNIGTQTYIVTGTSIEGCIDSDTVEVTVLPSPPVDFSASKLIGCIGDQIVFTSNSPGSVSCNWAVSNGATSNSCAPFIVDFDYVGFFDVQLTVTDANGCTSTLTNSQMIEIIENPNADFLASTYEIDNYNSEVSFTNTSINATSYSWDFGDNSPQSTITNPTHTFPTDVISNYLVTLYAYNNLGCVDSVSHTIRFIDDVVFYVPNTFTPDDDEYNQGFLPVFTSGFDPYDYHLMIFNRWGEIVFESKNALFGWDGTYGTDKKVCQDGTYVWKIEFKTKMTDERRMVVGHLNLIR